MKSLQTEQSVNELVRSKTNDAALRNLCAVTSVLPTLRSLRAQWVISLVARAIGTREGTQHRQLLANKAAACAAHIQEATQETGTSAQREAAQALVLLADLDCAVENEAQISRLVRVAA